MAQVTEAQALNSALFTLQQNGWRVDAVDDGEDCTNIDPKCSKLQARRQAIEAADAVEAARIGLRRADDSMESIDLTIIWGNGAECIVADYHAHRRWHEELDRLLLD